MTRVEGAGQRGGARDRATWPTALQGDAVGVAAGNVGALRPTWQHLLSCTLDVGQTGRFDAAGALQ